MNSAEYVDKLIADLKNKGTNPQEIAWKAALACKGWPYTYGARGTKTTKDGVPVRTFDCRGFTYWILLQVYGWKLMGAGCTSQWNTESNWKAKGKISDGFPKDTLVCLFYSKDNKQVTWEHTGFGLNDETVECSVGVQYFAKRKAKWTHWAIPVVISGEVHPEPPDPSVRPILRKGSKGEYVTLLQTSLLQRGYALPKYGVDGSYGAETEAAVKEFQRDNALQADGICGAKTWEALDNATPAKLYAVTIPHLPKYKAEAFITSYDGAYMTEE